MMRAERHQQVAALKAQGLSFNQIARRLGIARSTVTAAYYDPTGDADRARKAKYRGACEICGAPTSGSDGRESAPTRCRKHTAHYEQAHIERGRAAIEMLRLRREHGLSNREIASRMGRSPNTVACELSRMRVVGIDVPLDSYAERQGLSPRATAIWPDALRLRDAVIVAGFSLPELEAMAA